MQTTQEIVDMLASTGGLKIRRGDFDETTGHHDVADEVLASLEAEISVGDPFLTIATGTLGDLVRGDVIEFEDEDGEWQSYYIRDFRRIADGKLTMVFLSNVA